MAGWALSIKKKKCFYILNDEQQSTMATEFRESTKRNTQRTSFLEKYVFHFEIKIVLKHDY